MCMPQGWSYVGDRLLSAVIPYEESGWYDGQMWVKPTEVSISLSIIYTYECLCVYGCGGARVCMHAEKS